jgi:signal transduction histidine kinase
MSAEQIDHNAAALALREQERLGQELHDTLGPQLTAISMLAASLHERLRSHQAEETELAAKLLARVEQAKADVRAFAKGLLPVECDAEGLMIALTDLAEETEETHEIACRLECGKPVAVADNFTATRLYRIAKEAVHNAVKHADPREIRITLSDEDALTLEVQDDGSGVTDSPSNSGSGIRIMRHRCELIGGEFSIRPCRDGGTVVTCSISKESK